MVDGLPSLDLLLQLVNSERDKQLGHFDALDNKAGIVLGFAGLLVTLAPNVAGAYLVVGVLVAAVSAGAALAAFWPRGYPVLEPSPLRDYLTADERVTKLTVLDTLEVMVNQASRLLQAKGRRLRVALVGLVLAAAVFAAGILHQGLQG